MNQMVGRGQRFRKNYLFVLLTIKILLMTIATSEHLKDAVIKSIKDIASTTMPAGTRVILFGSRARHDARIDSDWDVLVLLDKDKISEQDHDNYTYPLWELGWKTNQMIHLILYTLSEWNRRKGSPFYENVEAEGVELC